MLCCSPSSTIQRKLEDAQERAQRRLQAFQTLIANFDTVTSEMETHRQWLTETQAIVSEEAPVGFSVEEAQQTLHMHNVSHSV